MSDDVVIHVEGLWKRYGLPLKPALKRLVHSLRNGSVLYSAFRNPQSEIPDDGPWALRDINLEVRRGETLGIIGRNGAGKSTLLKILAGVTPPTRGKVEVRGRVFSMIELNAGLHMELTGRENVRLLGAVMGLSRREIEAKMPEIEAFCELGEWFDRPVRMYSSGMLARLGFGVAMNVNAEILLVDEVLSVGDRLFQAKCYRKLRELKNTGTTLLMVSHDLNAVQRLTSISLLLEAGQTEKYGPTPAVVSEYYQKGDNGAVSIHESQPPKTEPLNVEITKVEFLDKDYRSKFIFDTGERMIIRVSYRAETRIENPHFHVSIDSPEGDVFTVYSTFADGLIIPFIFGSGSFDLILEELGLGPGVYNVNISIWDKEYIGAYDWKVGFARFKVRSDKQMLGRFYLHHSWTLDSVVAQRAVNSSTRSTHLEQE